VNSNTQLYFGGGEGDRLLYEVRCSFSSTGLYVNSSQLISASPVPPYFPAWVIGRRSRRRDWKFWDAFTILVTSKEICCSFNPQNTVSINVSNYCSCRCLAMGWELLRVYPVVMTQSKMIKQLCLNTKIFLSK
jgi:hypothetical protein